MRAKDRPLENDFLTDEEFEKRLRAWFGNASRVMLPGRAAYIWGGYANVGELPAGSEGGGPLLLADDHLGQAAPRPDAQGLHGRARVVLLLLEDGAAHAFYGPTERRRPVVVKKITPQTMVHLTEKPVELAARAIQYSSRQGENVLDLFGGSGSTLIGLRADRAACVPDGARPAYTRRDRRALADSDRPEGEAGEREAARAQDAEEGEELMLYLASPYSHSDPAVRATRYQQACWHAVRLMRGGRLVYSRSSTATRSPSSGSRATGRSGPNTTAR